MNVRIEQPVVVAAASLIGVMGITTKLAVWPALLSLPMVGLMVCIATVNGFLGLLLPPVARVWQWIIGFVGGLVLSGTFAGYALSRI